MAIFSSASSTLEFNLWNTWSSGLVAEFSLTPTDSLNGWTVTFDYPGEIVNIWNARIVSRVGDRTVVEAAAYNASVPAGGTVTFGFQGSGSVHDITPVAIGEEPVGDPGAPSPAPVPTLSVQDATASEEDGEISFQLTLSEPAATDVAASFQAVAGSAMQGADFSATTGQVVIPAGETSAAIVVPLTDDVSPEETETVSLELVTVDGAEIDRGTATGTILDTDVADDTGDGGGADDGGTDDDTADDGGTNDDGGTADDADDDAADDAGGPFVGGGRTYFVGQTSVVTDFDPATDVLDLGPDSIHNQIPVDTANGLKFLHMFNPGKSLLLEGVNLADLHPENFAPISDGHLQQDLSAALAWEDGTGLVRPDTVYVRSHEEGLQEIVDFDPSTDVISFFYLSVRGDGGLNFAVEQTQDGVRFYSPLTGQSMTLRDVTFADLDSTHFEWRANQLEDNLAGRMGLADEIDGFEYVSGNVFSGKSVAMAGLVDRAPYHSQPEYTGTPIGEGSDPADPGDGGTPDPVDPPDPVEDPDVPSDPPSGDGSDVLDAALVVSNDWGSGATVLLEITNTDSSAFTGGWTVALDLDPALIGSGWNSDWSANGDGTGIVVSDVGWNGSIGAGETVEVGFQLNQGGLDQDQLNQDADFLFI